MTIELQPLTINPEPGIGGIEEGGDQRIPSFCFVKWTKGTVLADISGKRAMSRNGTWARVKKDDECCWGNPIAKKIGRFKLAS